MTDVIETEQGAIPPENTAQLPQESAPPPIGADHTADDRTLDELLQEFDEKTRRPEPNATDEGAGESGAAVSSAELDKLLADLSGPTADQKRITDLEGQINNLHAIELERQSVRDFEGFSAELQKQLGPNLPEDYAKTSLLAAAAQDPNLLAAWKYRSLTAEELTAADREFRELEALHFRVTHSPDTDPRKAQAIQMIEQRGRELGIAMNARAIIMNARRAVLKRAEAHKVLYGELEKMLTPPPETENLTEVVYVSEDEASPELGTRNFNPALFNKKPRSWW